MNDVKTNSSSLWFFQLALPFVKNDQHDSHWHMFDMTKMIYHCLVARLGSKKMQIQIRMSWINLLAYQARKALKERKRATSEVVRFSVMKRISLIVACAHV